MASSTMSSGDFRTRADWRRVEHLYKQFSTIVSNNEEIPTEIAGALANSLGRVVAFYEDNEPLFVRDLLELWSDIDKLSGSDRDLFRDLYFDRRLDRHRDYNPAPGSGIRRRPRPFEAAVETCRRLKDLNNVRHALSNLQCGAILGGSVSYGRFYNITGSSPEFGSKASDTDLLVILKDYEQLESVAEGLSSISYLDRDSVDFFRRRAQIFPKIKHEQNGPCIFSHKLVVNDADTDPILQGTDIPSGYNLSLHVFSFADFDYLTLRDIAILEPPTSSDALDRTLHDYRDTASPKGAYRSRSFAGTFLGTHSLDPIKVDSGFVANVQVCLIKDGRFCPGLHQNLISPQFEMRWESESVRLYLRMLTFRWKILERLRIEKTMRPFEEQSLSLSHVRYFVFSPHITRRADRG
jgi:hypothetical protein